MVEAYNLSDVDELDDLEVLVHIAMDDMGDEGFEVNYSDIEERIERVERQINDILSTEPYTYGELLGDEAKVAELHEKLKAEYEDYEKYQEILKKTLDNMLNNGGMTLRWTMN